MLVEYCCKNTVWHLKLDETVINHARELGLGRHVLGLQLSMTEGPKRIPLSSECRCTSLLRCGRWVLEYVFKPTHIYHMLRVQITFKHNITRKHQTFATTTLS